MDLNATRAYEEVYSSYKKDETGKPTKSTCLVKYLWITMDDVKVRHTKKANHVKMEGTTIPVSEMFDLGREKI